MSPTATERREVDLVIGGMTCASCAARVERTLNKINGVTATVNYATEKAKISFPVTLPTEHLVAQVRAAGYTAAVPPPAVARAPVRPAPPAVPAMQVPPPGAAGSAADRTDRTDREPSGGTGSPGSP
ncbi:cation transporter, partial [Parafrankia elaeagni]|uniref:cation transporter n=1 Tax=Parafrankia elaeagni TaxID=222534 RepID=UPI0004756F4F